MFESQDDTLPRADHVLSHFQRNICMDARLKLQTAFKKVWGNQAVTIKSPLDFKVVVQFGRRLPEPVLKVIEEELNGHGWTHYEWLIINSNLAQTHQLVVTLDPVKAAEYV